MTATAWAGDDDRIYGTCGHLLGETGTRPGLPDTLIWCDECLEYMPPRRDDDAGRRARP